MNNKHDVKPANVELIYKPQIFISDMKLWILLHYF